MALHERSESMESFKNIAIDQIYNINFDMGLQNIYNLCTTEMTQQQAKRDQIIAFYIAILSFLVPALIDLKLAPIVQSVAYGLLWLVGIILCSVVRRYRIYKEAYWLTLRTITTLMRVHRDKINESMIKRLFWETMKQVQPYVAVIKEEPQTDDWLDIHKTWKKNSTSAEFLLYRLISVITAVVLVIAGYTLVYGIHEEFGVQIPDAMRIWVVLGACIPAVFSHRWCIRKFVEELGSVYCCCYDENLKSFEKTYSKAWFFHCSIQEPRENTVQTEKI